MARREIKHLLLKPKTRLRDKPWALPALMGAVLLGGVLLGVGVGLLAVDQPGTGGDRVVLDRAPRREEMIAPPKAEDPPVIPSVHVPPPRPGGPADEGVPYGYTEAAPNPDESDVPVAAPRPVQPVHMAPIPTPEAPARHLAMAPPSVTPTPAEPKAGMPTWQRFAVPDPVTGGRPMIAVVIDDMGIDRRRSEKMTHLRAPLTLSWLTYGEELPRQTAEARKRGHELLLHVPMQPMSDSYDPGQEVLEVGISAAEVKRRLNWGLDRFTGFVGINNHMGSRFTTDLAGMRLVMAELRRRGLLFLDSVTTAKTVGPLAAREAGVPLLERNVFLDNEESVASVRAQLAKLEAHARKYGAAIAIGHPRDNTLEALSAWLPTLEARGFVLVPLTTVLKAKGVQG